MDKLIPLPIIDISGGETSTHPAGNMPSKFSTLLQNWYIGENGFLRKVPGYTSVSEAAVSEALSNSFDYVKSTGIKETLCAGGGKIFRVSGDNELIAIKTGLDASAKVYFSQMNDIVIITNGIQAPLKYDGTSVSTLGGSPPGTAFKAHTHKNRVWMLDRTDKMIAYHSALNAVEDYIGDGSGYIDFKFVLSTGDELVDIVTYIDLLVFVLKNHIAIYSGSTPSGTSSDFALVQLISGVGAVGTGVTVPFGTDVAVMTPQGIIRLTKAVNSGDLKSSSISEAIEPTLRAALNNIAATTVLAGVHYQKYGWLLFLVGTTIYGYSYSWKAWFRIVGADAKGLSRGADGSIYITGTGYLYQYDSGWTFNGVKPVCLWKTAWIRLAPKGTSKAGYPKILEISHNLQVSTTLSITAEFDFKGVLPENVTDFQLGEAPPLLDGVADFDNLEEIDGKILPYETVRVPLFGKGQLMRLCFENTSADGPIELSGFTIYREIGR